MVSSARLVRKWFGRFRRLAIRWFLVLSGLGIVRKLVNYAGSTGEGV